LLGFQLSELKMRGDYIQEATYGPVSYYAKRCALGFSRLYYCPLLSFGGSLSINYSKLFYCCSAFVKMHLLRAGIRRNTLKIMSIMIVVLYTWIN